MDIATMNREQIALLVALVGVFGVVPLGWLINDIRKDKKAVTSAPDKSK
jgi:hypothetical protein